MRKVLTLRRKLIYFLAGTQAVVIVFVLLRSSSTSVSLGSRMMKKEMVKLVTSVGDLPMRPARVSTNDLSVRSANMSASDLKPVRSASVSTSDLKSVRSANMSASDLKSVRSANMSASDLKSVRSANMSASDLKSVRSANMSASDLKSVRSASVSTRDLSMKPANVSSSDLKSVIQEMTKLLKDKLALPNDAKKITFDKPCDDSQGVPGCVGPCDQPLNPDPAERLKNLLEDPALMLNDRQRELIMSVGRSIPENDYIIITACSSNHLNESQAMFYNLHNVVLPLLHNVTVVLFDIGLTSQERSLVKKNCRCHVITFPIEKFPEHVRDNRCFSWKPLMEMAVLPRARKAIIYQDSSVHWNQNLPELFNRTMIFGSQIIRHSAGRRIPAHTLPEMFNYMKLKPCTFLPYPEVTAGAVIHRNDAFNRRVLMETLARCALEKNCICPVKPRWVSSCRAGKLIHRCHRFDQSALTILLARIYGQDMYKILVPEYRYTQIIYFNIRRGLVMPGYFKP